MSQRKVSMPESNMQYEAVVMSNCTNRENNCLNKDDQTSSRPYGLLLKSKVTANKKVEEKSGL